MQKVVSGSICALLSANIQNKNNCIFGDCTIRMLAILTDMPD